jgi:hypothetical protein
MPTRPGYVWDATASVWVEIGQAAVVSPFKYQTSQPSSPATGDIWIDSDEDVPSVDSTLYYRWTKTMSGGETSLSGTDNNSLALRYTPGYESVFINGVLQVRGSDYVATTGTTVTGLTALTASDVVMVESIIAYSVGDTYTQSQISSLLDAKSPLSTTGLVLLNTTTLSSSSGVTISNVFTATYDNYLIQVSNFAGTTGDTFLRLTSSGTAATGSDYKYSGNYSLYTSGAYVGDASNGATAFKLNYLSSSPVSSSNITLMNPAKATNTSFLKNSHNFDAFLQHSGVHVLSTAYDGFTIYPASGTISGTIKVYGYK